MIQIELDKTRTLHFTLATIRDMERAGGKPLKSLISDLSDIGIDALVLTLTYGLRNEDPSISQNLVMKMVEKHVASGESIQPLFNAVWEALDASGVFRTSEDVTEGKSKTPALT